MHTSLLWGADICIYSFSHQPVFAFTLARLQDEQYSLEVKLSRGQLRCWFIGYGPHDHGGVVLVPTHKLIHDKQVVVEGGVAETASARTQHNSGLLQCSVSSN